MAPRRSIVLSEEQRKFIDKAVAGRNIMLDGVESSGKRTAVKEFCAKIPAKSKALYLTNSRFGKNAVEINLKQSNVLVDYYTGFAFRELRKVGIYGDNDDILEMFDKVKPSIKGYDYLIIGEFEDLTQEASKVLEVVKYRNPDIKIIAYGDVTHMVSEAGMFNARTFMEEFLGNYEKMEFRNCYVISRFDKGPDGDEDEEKGLPDDVTGGADEPESETGEAAKAKPARRSLGRGKKEEATEDDTPETKIAVIDTEINRKDEVMSIGVVIADALTFEPLEEKYYVIEPEHAVGGEFQKYLRIKGYVNVGSWTRREAISGVKALLKEHGIRSIFAYNATAEYERLIELVTYNWYDIMQVAAYRQYNSQISEEECHESGRLKKNFGVSAMIRRLSGEDYGPEENNAIYDARDELLVMKLLGRPIGDYVFTRVSESDVEGDADWQGAAGADMSIGEDALSAAEAEQLLGVSRGTIYNLIKRGEIFGYKRGQRYIVSEASVRDYIAKMEAAENFKYKATVASILMAILFALVYLWYLASKVM